MFVITHTHTPIPIHTHAPPHAAGDEVHLIHVIPPGQRLVVSPDLGIEGVIEDDDATKKKVVSQAAGGGGGRGGGGVGACCLHVGSVLGLRVTSHRKSG
jgi:hypothetical protein